MGTVDMGITCDEMFDMRAEHLRTVFAEDALLVASGTDLSYQVTIIPLDGADGMAPGRSN